MNLNDPNVLIIGIGNEFRRDDGAGVEVVRRLQKLKIPGIRLEEQSGEGVALMSTWAGYGDVILVDAVSSGVPPGTIHFLNPNEKRIPSEFFHYSTHAFSVAEAVELSRALGKLPAGIWIYGIEGEDFGTGQGLTPKVERSVGEVVAILEEFVPRISVEKKDGSEHEMSLRH